jgi:hypothetical protein
MLTDAALAALTASQGQSLAFFPPVRGFDENRWKFGQATRVDFGATNLASGAEIWIPRSSVSYVTVEEGAITIALRREMEYSNGAVWPVRTAVEEPDERQAQPAPEEESQVPSPKPQVTSAGRPGTRDLGPGTRRRQWSGEPLTLVLVTAGSAALALVLVLVAAHAWLQPPQRADSAPISDSNLYTLTGEDNYHDVVRKLGQPESERELSLAGAELQQRALIYRNRNYAVVLLGVQGQRNYNQEPRYIGAIRLSDGAVVASIHLSHDSTTDSLLKIFARQLKQ